MSEENKTVELKDEELEKVTGGAVADIKEGEIQYRYGDIVKDTEGIKYKILYHHSYDALYRIRSDGTIGHGTNYYCAQILFIPESIKPFTGYNVDDNYIVDERKINYC